jgi:phage shock protein A
VLKELAGDAALDRFRAEYEKVFRALKKSHDSEKRLIKKCRELNAEIVSGAAKVQAALKLSDEDRATIAALKKEIENSWRVVDSSHEKVRWAHEQPPATQLTWQGGWRRMAGIGCGHRSHSSAAHLPPPLCFLPAQELKAKEQVAALKLEISGLTKLLEQVLARQHVLSCC